MRRLGRGRAAPRGADSRPRRKGFTLVEVAVTIVIVGVGLTLVLQAMKTAELTAAHTRNYKLARELGLLTLGRIESGLYREDLRDRFMGSYAEEGYPDFHFEVVLGDEVFEEELEDPDSPFYDRWNDPDYGEEDEEEDEESQEPYEKVKVRISFPQFLEYKNQLDLEAWVPWTQVYGEEEEEEEAAAAGAAGEPGP